MNTTKAFTAGLALGAGLLYFLDPERGARRRALVRDRVVHARHSVDDTTRSAARHARNRIAGVLHETAAGLAVDGTDDRVLAERVRAEIGRVVSNAGRVEVTAYQGHVQLDGRVRADEIQRLVRVVRRVRGVDGVDNRLELVDPAEAVQN